MIRFICLLLLFSCASSTPNGKYLESILTLNEGAELPPQFVQELSTTVLAQNLVERLYLTRDQFIQSPEAPQFDFQKDTKIVIQFSDRHIDSIAEKCFLNSHQIGTTQGAFTPLHRSQIEDEMIGVKLEAEYKHGINNPVNELRPKYAYLTFTNRTGDFVTTYDALYGNVFAEMKDNIKKQSTFSAGDSLAMGKNHKDGKYVHTFKLTTNPGFERGGSYWEAQIWGKVCFSDVERFMINCSGMTKVSPEAIEKLKSIGPPVIECPVAD